MSWMAQGGQTRRPLSIHRRACQLIETPMIKAIPVEKRAGNTGTRREEREALTSTKLERVVWFMANSGIHLCFDFASCVSNLEPRFLPSFWKYKTSFIFAWSNYRMNLEKMDHINMEKLFEKFDCRNRS